MNAFQSGDPGLDNLPRWARVAYIARCARRCLPLYEHEKREPLEQRIAVARAVLLAEMRAARGGDPQEFDFLEVDGQFVDDYDLCSLQSTLWGVEEAAANTFADLSGDNEVGKIVRNFLIVVSLTRSAFDCAFEECLDERLFFPPEIGGFGTQWRELQSPEVQNFAAADLRMIQERANLEQWSDTSPVPPEVFGPVWPHGLPKTWPTPPAVFRPRARMLLLLGDQLIRDAGIAVFELAKNAYDADATYVRVTIEHPTDLEKGRVSVEDDGCGMTYDQVVSVWLEPGTDYRSLQKEAGVRTPKFNRLPLGEKGVGRFAAHKLGRKVQLTTRSVGEDEVVVEVDWDTFQKARYLSDAQVSVIRRQPEVFLGESTGTRIEVAALREAVSRGLVRQVQRAITSLCSPFKEPSEFRAELVVRPDASILHGILTMDRILDLAPYRATCLIDDGFLTYDYEFRPYRGMDRIEGRTLSGKTLVVPGGGDFFLRELFTSQIGPILIEVRAFDLDAHSLDFGVSDKKGFKDFLRANGGFRVYRDGVRVYDYGEPGNDWLGLGTERANAPQKRVGNNQVIGAVHLSGQSSNGLVEKTNREGFIENEAVNYLQSLVGFAIQQITTERNGDKLRLRSVYAKAKRTEKVLTELIDLRGILDSMPEAVKAEVVPAVDELEKQYLEMRDRLLTAAGSGLALTVVIHEVEKAIRSLVVAIERKASLPELKNISDHMAELIEGLTYLTRKSGRKKESFSKLASQAAMNVGYRLRAHDIALELGFEQGATDLTVVCTRRLILATLMNLIDNSIYWMSNKGGTDKRIYIGSTNDLRGGPALIVADTGPGFSDPPDLLVEPFVTRKPEGMGLGLHIADQVMQAHDGRIVFPEDGEVDLPSVYTGAVVALKFGGGE